MTLLCANLSWLYYEVDFLDRFYAAAKADFKDVEYLFPYEFDKEQLADRLAANGLTQVLHNLLPGSGSGGDRG